ncbi:MAG: nucleotidyltransferase family protein [Candidatus Micrarchaeota archaeon]|nr:nucleotidyltransferase family protein [Candidatus Micrarchaeota archaeon]
MADGNQAVILAGGRGQRLRPYTDVAPKPMLQLGSKPILEYTITNLRKNGFTEIIIAAGYKHEVIEEYFGDGSKFGVNIEYSIEETPKDTGGALLEIKDKLKKHFVMGMADHITDINLRKMYEHHIKTKSMITIALEEMDNISEYGVVDVEKDRVTGFREKPRFSNFINTAIFAIDKEMINYIEPGENISSAVIPRLLQKGKLVNYYVTNEFWKDIGTVKEYENLRDMFASFEVYHNLFGKE